MSVTLGQALSHATLGDLVNADGVGWISLALAAGFLVAVGPLRRRHPGLAPVGRRQLTYFLLGVFTLYAAVGGPLDFVADHDLFTAHMLEHVLLLFVLPPLWLAGTPAWLARAILGPRWLRRAWTALTHPATALVVFNAALALWHFPAPYDAALANGAIHFGEHVSFVLIGLIAWWPVLSPLPEMPPLHEGAQLAYLFVEEVLMTVLFAIITFAPGPLYPFYLHVRQRLWGITPLQDQQYGGVLMRLGSMLTFGVAGKRALELWMKRDTADLPPQAFVSKVAAPSTGAAPARQEANDG